MGAPKFPPGKRALLLAGVREPQPGSSPTYLLPQPRLALQVHPQPTRSPGPERVAGERGAKRGCTRAAPAGRRFACPGESAACHRRNQPGEKGVGVAQPSKGPGREPAGRRPGQAGARDPPLSPPLMTPRRPRADLDLASEGLPSPVSAVSSSSSTPPASERQSGVSCGQRGSRHQDEATALRLAAAAPGLGLGGAPHTSRPAATSSPLTTVHRGGGGGPALCPPPRPWAEREACCPSSMV
ncbi:PREDICTED: putative HTLV-1-related endogenous sequence [Gekko japonicus]|uniref:HTLV-1-related endogenous sequence n=1 Tax=Gekko japonicus TaxID=146911 RepID=A0ABM1KBS0_GEKJA|nr:PREDICTED: putative HTLV-1-related endogenous sequence [Gekko japonicus]